MKKGLQLPSLSIVLLFFAHFRCQLESLADRNAAAAAKDENSSKVSEEISRLEQAKGETILGFAGLLAKRQAWVQEASEHALNAEVWSLKLKQLEVSTQSSGSRNNNN